ncbi:ABC transporter substrate-binding protein [Kyrpidia spormannii]|nr:ABC transporter substrate-binding protein [Kyrpidia spormannii]
MIKKRPLLSTLALVSLVLAGCNTAANTPTNSGSSGGSAGGGGDTVKVAAITSFTTSTAPLGIPGYNAEKMAIDEINAKGGLLGKKIELEKFDDNAKPNLASQYAQTAILNDHVVAIFGPVSSASAAAIESVAAQNKTLVFFHTSNDINLTTKGFTKYAFQVVPNTNMEATAVALFIKEKGWKRIATISPNYSYGRDTVNHFLQTLKDEGVDYQVVAQQWPQLGTTDYNSDISAVLAAKPDVVFSPLYGGDLATFAKQAIGFGLFQKTAFVSQMGPTVLQTLGNDAPVGAWGYARAPFFAIDTPGVKDFVDKYHKQYGDYPNSYAILAYTAVQTWAYGVQKAGTFDADKVADAIAGATIDTIRGPITIRKSDHQAEVGEWVGHIAKTDKYPFAIWEEIKYFPPSQIMNAPAPSTSAQ